MIDEIRQANVDDGRLQVRHAVLNRSAPIQNARMKFGIGCCDAAIRIDAECGGRVSTRDGVPDLSGDRDRSHPGKRVRKIAQSFAEINGRRVGIEGICADARRTCPAPFDGKTDRHHELMRGVFQDPVLERGLKVLEPVRSRAGRATGWAEPAVGGSNGDRESLGDPLGKLAGEIELSERGIVAGLEAGNGRKRQLVVDDGIIDPEGRGKKAVSDDFVGGAFS